MYCQIPLFVPPIYRTIFTGGLAALVLQNSPIWRLNHLDGAKFEPWNATECTCMMLFLQFGNHLRFLSKIPPNTKIPNTKIHPPYSRPPPLTHWFSIGTPSICILEFLYFCFFAFCSICILFHLYFVAIVFCYVCILAICILSFCILS